MTSAEVKWAVEQWRAFEEMVYVYSRGAAWLRTDVKVIDPPFHAHANEEYGFWPGPQHELLDRYVPFERGDYDSYNSIYNSKDLRAGPWGGTYGADLGPKGCGSSDNAWLSRGPEIDERHGFASRVHVPALRAGLSDGLDHRFEQPTGEHRPRSVRAQQRDETGSRAKGRQRSESCGAGEPDGPGNDNYVTVVALVGRGIAPREAWQIVGHVDHQRSGSATPSAPSSRLRRMRTPAA